VEGAQTPPPGQQSRQPEEPGWEFHREGAAFPSWLWRLHHLPQQLPGSHAGLLQSERMDM